MPVHPFPSLAKLEMEVVGLLRLAGMRRPGVGFLDIKVSRRSKKATSGSNRCFGHSVDSLLPVRACCHASKSRGFDRFYLLLDLNQ
ncbi:hypothetical protein V6N11_079914 [Hibiscus sabdariffa]|uniref:Uncharacterized protein n=1 Tax=Hibiscus sabdariffa TaxID=183260 RepID=A0ABR2RX73_9ROSI